MAASAVIELRDPPAHLLTECERRRVLQVGAADLDDVGERRGLARRASRAAAADLRQELRSRSLSSDRDVHRGRKRVVAALRHVDVIVGMDRRLAAARRARELVRAIRDDLVHVHVGLRPAPRLPHDERKLARVLARDHLVRRADDQLALSSGSRPRSALTTADAFLIVASAAISSRGKCSRPMRKFSSERCVCAPQ